MSRKIVEFTGTYESTLPQTREWKPMSQYMIIDKEGNLTPINDDRLARMQVRLLAALLESFNMSIDASEVDRELIVEARMLAAGKIPLAPTPPKS